MSRASMRSMLRLFSVIAFALLCAQPALALPTPMSDAELEEKSDVVALVRVLSVICTSVTKDPTTGETLPGYLAKLQVLEVKKGDVKVGEELAVTFHAIPTGMLGPWTVFYYPGEEVWTHLIKREGGVAYATTWWNAKGVPVKEPETKDLPTQIGQSVVASDAP